MTTRRVFLGSFSALPILAIYPFAPSDPWERWSRLIGADPTWLFLEGSCGVRVLVLAQSTARGLVRFRVTPQVDVHPDNGKFRLFPYRADWAGGPDDSLAVSFSSSSYLREGFYHLAWLRVEEGDASIRTLYSLSPPTQVGILGR